MNHPSELQVRNAGRLSGHKAAVYALCAGHAPTRLLSGAGDGWIVEWDIATPDTGRLIAVAEGNVFSLLFLPEYDRIVAGNMNGGLHWIDLSSPGDSRNILHHRKGVYELCRDGAFVFSAGGDGVLSRWDPVGRRPLESYQLSGAALRCIARHPVRDEMAVGSSDGNVYLLTRSDWSPLGVIREAHASSVFSAAYSPDGRQLLTGGRDAHLNAWAVDDGYARVSSRPAHWFTVNSIAFDPAGRLFATGSRDKTVKLWDAADGRLLKVLDTIRHGGHVNSVNRLYWAAPGLLVSASDDRSLILWEINLPEGN